MAFADHDGVKLFYEEAGSGDPPLVFVHGWCCDHTYFQPQFDHFKSSHRVVALDLRGHGQSDKPEGRYDMATLADGVAAMCRRAGVDKPIVVGHSMGGCVAMELSSRHPGLIGGVVLCDSPVMVPETLKPMMAGFIDGLRGPGYAEVARGFVGQMLFLDSDDAALKSRVVAAMSAAPQHVMLGCMEEILNWDGEAAARGCRAPVLFIGADQIVGSIDQFKEVCPKLQVEQTPGVGHFHQLLAPDAINAILDRFVNSAVA